MERNDNSGEEGNESNNDGIACVASIIVGILKEYDVEDGGTD